jgi:hypothetical protein
MAGRILQINFKIGVERGQYEELASSLAQAFAEVPGLLWKIWIVNEGNHEAGGVYHFESETALGDFLSSQLASDVQAHPAVSEFSAKTFEVMDSVTVTTRGPVVHEVLTP